MNNSIWFAKVLLIYKETGSLQIVFGGTEDSGMQLRET